MLRTIHLALVLSACQPITVDAPAELHEEFLRAGDLWGVPIEFRSDAIIEVRVVNTFNVPEYEQYSLPQPHLISGLTWVDGCRVDMHLRKDRHETIVAHELGHALSIEKHSRISGNIMNVEYRGWRVSSSQLGKADRAARDYELCP